MYQSCIHAIRHFSRDVIASNNLFKQHWSKTRCTAHNSTMVHKRHRKILQLPYTLVAHTVSTIVLNNVQ